MNLYIDISNYVSSKAHTGIQRVVREILFRLLKTGELFDLKIIFFNSDVQKFVVLSSEDVLGFLNDVKSYEFKNISNLVDISDMLSGDVFFDMDGVWNNSLKRCFLYKRLKEQNVTIFNFIYDLVPILLPQYSHENTTRNFVTFLHAVYQYSDLVFFDSRSAEKDFLEIKDKINNHRDISTRVVKLGSDVFTKTEKNFITLKTKQFNKSKYILFVGTLEPRKNQRLMLDVFEKLILEYSDINLIFVGKAGWNNDQLIHRIQNHKLLEKSLFWLNDVNDYDLVSLYRNAYLCVYLSAYEGFGLPIAESLSHGSITITSKNSSMYEVGKNFADYLVYNSFNELYELADLYLSDLEIYKQKKNYIKNFYVPYSWGLTYFSVINVLNNYSQYTPIITPTSLQFVFISIDKKNLQGTIQAIDKLMDFVDSYVIVTREDMFEEMNAIQTSNVKHIINENLILGEYAKDFSKRDHQSKNWLLRASLLNLDILHDQFIMLDDDNRPLRKIDIEHFISDGKYNAYYFYDLLEWNSFHSDYDYGQHNMKALLDKDGFELLSYSSHRPQIINKKILNEVVIYYFDIGLIMPIDEWSIYFNYAVSKYPFLFNKLIFDTLNWPGNPSDWPLKYYPKEYNFENYYSSLYDTGLFKSDHHLEYCEKISLKEKQYAPYFNNTCLYEDNRDLLAQFNMTHGVLKFKLKVGEIILSGLPYYIEATQGSWLKISLNYKSLNLNNHKLELFYWICGKKGAKNNIEIQDAFFESAVDFGISCENLQEGDYDLLIDVLFDDEALYGLDSPYLLKLKVKNKGALPDFVG